MLDQKHLDIFEQALHGFRMKFLASTREEEEVFSAELKEKLLAKQKAEEEFRQELELSKAEREAVKTEADRTLKSVRALGAEVYYSSAINPSVVDKLRSELYDMLGDIARSHGKVIHSTVKRRLNSLNRLVNSARDVVFVLGLDKAEDNSPVVKASFAVRNPIDGEDRNTGIVVAGMRFLQGQVVTAPFPLSELKNGRTPGDKVQELYQKWVKEFHRT